MQYDFNKILNDWRKIIGENVWGGDGLGISFVDRSASWLVWDLEFVGMSKGFTGGGKRAIGYRTAPAKIIENDFLSL